jgi:glycerol-3-phosphate dehydrogenase (NAD(P)+)
MKRVSLIGAGSWGTALAIVAAKAGHAVSLWSRNPEVVASIEQRRVNSIYLDGVHIPHGITVTHDLREALNQPELLILAAPSHAVRALLGAVASDIDNKTVLINGAKGIEVESGKRISQVAAEILSDSIPFVCLSGPSFAKEVVENHPTAIVAASINNEAARIVQEALSFENLRIYTNSDVVGTELGGSVKNIMAIAAGMVSGLGLGSNSVAALITRGLAEISRLALDQGAKLETMMGLAGLGDLVLTCTGTLSRNRYVGEQLARGMRIDEIVAGMNEVAEGIKTTSAVKTLADRAGIEMPITNQVYEVIYKDQSVREAVTNLMSRPLREEI